MTLADLIRTAGRFAFRRKMRAALTIVAVVIGAFTFTITSGLGNGVNSYIESQTRAVGATDTVQVTKSSPMSFLNERMEEWDDSMVAADMDMGSGIISDDEVRQIESLVDPADEALPTQQVTPLYYFAGDGPKFRFVYNGNWPGKTANLSAGQQLTDETSGPKLIIPDYAVEPLGFASAESAVGATLDVAVLGRDGQVRDLRATVSGVQVKSLIGGNIPFGNQAFGQALEELSEAGGDPAQAAWYSSVLVTSDDIPGVVDELTGAGYTVSTAEQIVGDYRSIVNAILLLMNVLASVAILAAMFGIVNTLLMSVHERTRQIGMYRALGMPRTRVFQLIALEALLLALVGAVLAVALGVIAGRTAGPAILSLVGLDFPGLELFRFNPLSLSVIVVAVLIAALIAAVLPASRAARLKPMDALREAR